MWKIKGNRPIILLIFLILAVSVQLACAGLGGSSFYSDTGDIDAMYLPLVEPYKAVKLNGSSIWSIDLIVPPEAKEIYYYLHIYDVDKVAVQNDVILMHSPHVTASVVESIGEKVLHWFVIVPNERVETGFEAEDEFLSYISKYGIDEPSWVGPDAAYAQFVKTGCLTWIPGCD